MSVFKKINIGFVVTEGCRVADIIGPEAVLRLHPRNKVFYISNKEGVVNGAANFGIVANTTYNNCPDLDVLVVGEMKNEELEKPQLINFIHEKSQKAKFIIGISNGVWALYRSGCITDKKVTADQATLKRLKKAGLNVVDKREVVIDGQLITSGPSTGAIEAAFTVNNKLRGEWLTKLIELNLEYMAPVQYPLQGDVELERPATPRPLNVGVFLGDQIFLPDIMGATDVFACLPNTRFYYLSDSESISNSILGIGPKVKPTTTLEECPDLDVFIIGATHPKYLKDHQLLDFILKQEQSASAIITVCAGTFVVGSAGLLDGKNAATNFQQINSLPRIGVCPSEKDVVVDGKYYSAGPAVGSYVVALKAVEEIINKEWAQYIEHSLLEFNPNPLYNVGAPHLADKSMLRISKVLTALVLNPLFHSALKKGYYGRT